MRVHLRTAVVAVIVLSVGGSAAGQASNDESPLTPWGHPDLQGQWNSQTSVPLERPLDGSLSGPTQLTEEDAAAFERENRARFDLPPREGSPGNYNAFWRDFGNPLPRTSLIFEPPDGRIPPLTPDAQRRLDAEAAARRTRGPSDSPDTYADLSNWTRCISRGWNGIGSWYSSNYQIFQTPDYVVVFQELIHEPRIIPLDGRPHLPDTMRQWMGDSRGRWEGSTLVVETTNFDPKTSFRGARDTLHLTERYTRVDDDTIDYRFTINDPHTFTRPWSVVRPMTRIDIDDRRTIFEYACHEGNYGMTGILAGARAAEIARPMSAQSVDSEARQTLHDELDDFFDQYYSWYSAGAADEISRHAYNVPYLRGDGSALGTRDEVRQWVAEAWARLDAEGYGRSNMPDRNICILGRSAAIVSGRGVRYRKDGSIFGEYGWTYSLVKTDDGWRIITIYGHEPELVVRCE